MAAVLSTLGEAGAECERILVTAEEVWARVEGGELSEKVLSAQGGELVAKFAFSFVHFFCSDDLAFSLSLSFFCCVQGIWRVCGC